ncbi:MAG: hypothetical protein R2932_48450 [Caldilineaceae bacterium]
MQRFITVLAILLFTLVHSTTVTLAQSEHCTVLGDGWAYRLKRAMPLADPIVEQTSMGVYPYQFTLNSIFILLEEGERVLLSGSATGDGFVTDDIVTLEVIPGDKSRSWDFRSQDQMTIVPVTAPQDITDLFKPGHSMITISMQDLLGPVYSSSGYWLLLYATCTLPTTVATPSPTATSVPSTSTPTPLSPTATATVASSAVNLATPETVLTPTADESASLPKKTDQVRSNWLQLALLFWDWVLLGVVLLGAGLWQLLKQHPLIWPEQITQWRAQVTIALQPVWQRLHAEWASLKAYLERHKR